MPHQLEAGSSTLYAQFPELDHTPPPQKRWVIEDVSVCASPGDFTSSTPRRRRTWTAVPDNESLGSALRKAVMEHQLGLSLNFVLLLGMTYVLFPSLRDNIRACFTLSYASDVPGQYGHGLRDMYLVASCVIYFTGFRAFMLDYVLMPMAASCGIGRKKGRVRFAEQAYMLVYYAIYWFWGLAVFIKDTPSGITNVNDLLLSLWRDFPRLLMPAGIKAYYLTQFAFWIQQIVVIHLEERRKDHYQMLTHHFVTVGLMGGSYSYRQWRVGNAILVCMDVVDLVLPLAKILRYLGMQTACDCAFGLFVVTWIAARHVCYVVVCWSLYAHASHVAMLYGVYSTDTGERLSTDGGTAVMEHLLQPMLRPEAKTFAWNANIRGSFLALLGALQVITLAWLVMIMRVVIRVIGGQGADDTRSDDEGGEEEEEDPIPSQPSDHGVLVETEKPRFIEVEASSEEHNWPSRKAMANGKRKSKGISSGLNLGEHKDLLNRIGCLSEEQLTREREARNGSASPRPASSGMR
ncbi:Putative TRAM1-like protein [Septoria linicola]|uniref:TRAM1-like protein n=1 Tax=Septoria linicola TaxID=215465 RepID=A0A9Q9EJH9_9PEZI|nr:putative TRAM1-like protein [Septoria linicola]USW52202.1 Putative TRAM1-like protein [Septoria linicola]